MSHILHRIDQVCEKHGLSKLNDLAVNEDDKPGRRKHDPCSVIMAERRRVFDFDWYALVPPTPEEYREAVWEVEEN